MERRVFRPGGYTNTATMAAVSKRAVMPSAVFENVHSKSRSRRSIARLIFLRFDPLCAVTWLSQSRESGEPSPAEYRQLPVLRVGRESSRRGLASAVKSVQKHEETGAPGRSRQPRRPLGRLPVQKTCASADE